MHSYLYLFIIFLAFFLNYSLAQYSGRDIPPSTVDELDLDAYLGRWFQMYASLTPNTTYERGGYCVTGDYYAIDNQDEGSYTAPIAFSLVNSMK